MDKNRRAMNKVHTTLLVIITALLVFQSVNHVLTINNMEQQIQQLSQQLKAATQNTSSTKPSNEDSATPITTTVTETDSNTQQRLAKIIDEHVQKALANYTKQLAQHELLLSAEQNQALNQQEVSKQNATNAQAVTISPLEEEQSQEAYWAALDIVTEAQLQGVWDQSVNDKLAVYQDQMTDKQRNDIVGQYIRAFNNGLIDANMTPPF